jgi:hypothetical protein
MSYFYCSKVRLEFEHSNFDYYSELDAVQICGCLYDIADCKTIASNLRHIADSFKEMLHLKQDKKGDQEEEEEDKGCPLPKEETPPLPPSLLRETLLADKEIKRKMSDGCVKISSASTILDLPYDILNIILLNLDLQSLFSLRSTCKFFYSLCSESSLFKKLDLHPYWNKVISI